LAVESKIKRRITLRQVFQMRSVGTCLARMALDKESKSHLRALRNKGCENSTKKRKEYQEQFQQTILMETK